MFVETLFTLIKGVNYGIALVELKLRKTSHITPDAQALKCIHVIDLHIYIRILT
ncbi:hypothetical protein KDK_05340 [Dictyobacter kobayashii]|uniref:Uncharacterized protein n=1 Tax=Dictyobacter kobayashii TaxID=2014872 RepID=A0A402ACA5_9CHLR|nr:hypothetical protein KDK_05340 [Dictyobacter kobayashii]